jgi:alpha-1,6-mannosyltransferase
VATPEIARFARPRRLPYARYARDAVAAAALAGTLVASFLFAAQTASGPSQFVFGSLIHGHGYPDWLAGPLRGAASPISLHGFIALLLILYGLYLVVVALADAVRPSWVIGSIALLHVVFLLGPPTWLSDAFNYIGFARLGAEHGLDPYTHHISAIASDPVYPYVTWNNITTPYGPLFTLASYVLAPLGLGAALWTLKIGVAAASLACLALVWRLARELDRPPAAAVAFVGLNPLWLLFGVGGAHNDMFMLALLLGGILLVLRGRETAAGTAFVGAMAIKVTAGLALPFVWLATRRRRKLLIGALAAAGVVLLVTAVASRGHVLTALTSFAGEKQRSSLRSFPGQIAQHFLGVREVPSEASAIALPLFAIVVVGLLLAARRSGDWITAAGWAALALLLALNWVMPWYIVWLLPFAALSTNRRLRYATLLFGAFLVVVRMPYPPFT